MRGFTAFGKEVKDVAGEHFADASTEVAARLIVAALNFRNHHPVVDDGEVICGRCRSVLPDDGGEPCIPRAPRCRDTPDMFEEETSSGTGRKYLDAVLREIRLGLTEGR